MTTTSIVIFAFLVALGTVQVAFALAFLKLLRMGLASNQDAMSSPQVSVLLSLRGADPFLAKGLRKLMHQDYPNYDLRIVVDREGDPSWGVVQEAIAETGFDKVSVSSLKRRSDRCSLKCSALVQLAKELDSSTEIVVLADADLVSHDRWLHELVAPLADPKVGATHGNRWFWPQQERWGSLVRYLWNVAAVVPMYVFGIPWGGTFAMRASLLRESGLLDKWSKAVVEDAPVRSVLEANDLEVCFVPSLMMVNREDCDLAFSLDFIKRQLTWTKIYHPRWAPIVMHAIATTSVLFVAAGVAIAGLIARNLDAAAWTSFGLLGYLLTMVALVLAMDHGVRRVVVRRGEESFSFSWQAKAKLCLAIPLTQCIHFVAVLLAMFRNHVVWRGVTYHVRGPWDIQLVNYRPYEQDLKSADSNHSL